ncbi:MAG: hypothetical protein MUF36_08720 [Bacteroidales bacterium]|jgi:hypothetical protein|nr:hypothetical protein [Bacteroidales bacterium]
MERKVKSLQVALSAMIILAFLAMPFSTYAQAGKTNFAGSWAFNAEKSQMGQGQGQPPQGQGQGQRMGGFGGGNFTATQEANLLSVTRTMNDQSFTSKYTLDGKESVNTTQRGDSKSVASWTADGKVLTIVTTRTFERDGQSTTIKTTEEWSLTDANTLSIKSTRTSPNGDRVTTAVYNKK